LNLDPTYSHETINFMKLGLALSLILTVVFLTIPCHCCLALDTASRETVRQRLGDYIRAVKTHFKG
jgi:hypothetical protein